MVACDSEDCPHKPFEWFHFTCMKLKQEPVGKWYCGDCRELQVLKNMKSGWRRKEKKRICRFIIFVLFFVGTVPVRWKFLFLKFVCVYPCNSNSSWTNSFSVFRHSFYILYVGVSGKTASATLTLQFPSTILCSIIALYLLYSCASVL